MNKITHCMLFVLLSSFGFVGCNSKKKTEGAAEEAVAALSDENAGALATSDSTEEVIGALFDKSLVKKACELLPTAQVVAAFDLPEAEVKQLRMMGCSYTWEEGAEEMNASVRIINVAKTPTAAARWFKNATKGMSPAEAKAAMTKVKERASKNAKADTREAKVVIDKIGDATIEAGSKAGIQFRSLPDLGDEARLALSDGNIWIRVGNLAIVVSGYKGKQMPPPVLKSADLKNLAAVMVAQVKKWEQDTLTERERDGKKVAKLVLGNLPKK